MKTLLTFLSLCLFLIRFSGHAIADGLDRLPVVAQRDLSLLADPPIYGNGGPVFTYSLDLTKPLKGIHCLKTESQIRSEAFEKKWREDNAEMIQAYRKASEKSKAESLRWRQLRIRRNGTLQAA